MPNLLIDDTLSIFYNRLQQKLKMSGHNCQTCLEIMMKDGYEQNPSLPFLSNWPDTIDQTGALTDFMKRLEIASKQNVLALFYLLDGFIKGEMYGSYTVRFEKLRDRLKETVYNLAKIYDLLSTDIPTGYKVENYLPGVLPKVLERDFDRDKIMCLAQDYWLAVSKTLEFSRRNYNGEINVFPVQYLLQQLIKVIRLETRQVDLDMLIEKVIVTVYDQSLQQDIQKDIQADNNKSHTTPVFALTIYIDALGSNTPNEADCQYRLYYTAPDGCNKGELTGTYDELKSGFARVVSGVLFDWYSEKKLLVEFILPENCLHWDVDQWKIDLDPATSNHSPTLYVIGKHFPVALRYRGRYEHETYVSRLKNRYDQAKSQIKIHWCGGINNEHDLMEDDQIVEDVLYLIIGCPLNSTKREYLWKAVRVHGIPVVLWHRAVDVQSSADIDRLKTLLATDNRPLAFEQVPINLRKWRMTASSQSYADFAEGVSLLWEDPTRIPSLIKQKGDPLGGRHSPLAAQTALDSNSSTNMQAWIDLIS